MCTFTVISFGQYALDLQEFVAERLNFTVVVVLAAAAYKLAVAQLAPPVGYLTVLDWYVLSCIGIIAFQSVAVPLCHLARTHSEVCDRSSCALAFAMFVLQNAWLLRQSRQSRAADPG